ncbi:Rieske (2Fe-2S) protein [Streptomyces roseifaciens]
MRRAAVLMRTFRHGHSARPADRLPALPLPYPSGWFCVGFSPEWKPGDVRAVRFMGGDIVVFRTRRGLLRATLPYCPHLGAHLGAGGTVDGEYLVCPFHKFAFAVDGSCARTPYGVPPKASLTVLPSREAYGIVWVWHSPGGSPPSWELPLLPRPVISPSASHVVDRPGRPQELMRDVAGHRHFTALHGVDAIDVLSEPVTGGPVYSTAFRVSLGLPCFSVFQDVTLRILGLGAALFLTESAHRRLDGAHWVLVTPVDPGHVRYRVASGAAMLLPPTRLPAPLRRGVERALGRGVNHWTLHGARTGRPGSHRAVPLPSRRDEPADGRSDDAYRQWSRQFYPTERAVGTASSLSDTGSPTPSDPAS